jgi:hypothetical protein
MRSINPIRSGRILNIITRSVCPELHAYLSRLVRQTQRVAHGDLRQRADFVETFSAAVNSMIALLREKRRIEEEPQEANTTIVEGIHAAYTVQSALLSRESKILNVVPDSFCIWN